MSAGLNPVLADIHRLRLHLRQLQTEIERGPRTLKVHQATLAKEEQAYTDSVEAVKRLKITLHQDEVTLKETSTRLARYEDQLGSMATEKEIEAKKSEISKAKAKIDQLENAMLENIAALEAMTAAVPANEAKVKAAREAFAQFEGTAKERHARLVAETASATAELQVAEAKLPPEPKALLTKLVGNFGADALAAAETRACGHCHASLTSQKWLNIDAGKFVTCESCQRILYLRG